MTSWEVLVLHPSFLRHAATVMVKSGRYFLCGHSCSAIDDGKTVVLMEKRDGHGKICERRSGRGKHKGKSVQNMSDAIIPALKHRIPSELRS